GLGGTSCPVTPRVSVKSARGALGGRRKAIGPRLHPLEVRHPVALLKADEPALPPDGATRPTETIKNFLDGAGSRPEERPGVQDDPVPQLLQITIGKDGGRTALHHIRHERHPERSEIG